MARKRTVMIFGVFDLLHAGHIYLLYYARRQGTRLIVVVARDTTVKTIKGRSAAWNERLRMRAVTATGLASKVILGDKEQGTYRVIASEKPDLICFGYDQRALQDDLAARMRAGTLGRVRTKTLRPYRGGTTHTSHLRNGGNS